MTTIRQRLMSSFFVVAATAAGLATPASVQAQYAPQQRAAEGSHVWGQDGWCYVVQAGRYVRMNYFRSFPDRSNPKVFDLFVNGQFQKRVDVSQPGWIMELTAAYAAANSTLSWYMYPVNQTPTEANTFFKVKATGQWVNLAQLRAAAAAQQQQRAIANNPGGYLGGYGSTLPSPGNPAGTLGGLGSALPSANPASQVGGYRRTDMEVLIAAQTGANWRSPYLDPNCAASYNGCR